MFRLLVEAHIDVDVNHCDKYGNNMMQMYLTRNEPHDPMVVKYLLEMGFNTELLQGELVAKIENFLINKWNIGE